MRVTSALRCMVRFPGIFCTSSREIPRPGASMARGRHRRAHRCRLCVHQPFVVRITITAGEPPQSFTTSGSRPAAPAAHSATCAQTPVEDGPQRQRALGGEPAAPAMPGRVPTDQPVEPSEQEYSVTAAFEPTKVLLHVGRSPRSVAGQLPDVVPVGIVRAHDDHCVVPGTAAQSAGAWIEHAIDHLAVPAPAVAPVLLLLCRRRVMAHPEIPPEPGVLRGEGMKCRDQ